KPCGGPAQVVQVAAVAPPAPGPTLTGFRPQHTVALHTSRQAAAAPGPVPIPSFRKVSVMTSIPPSGAGLEIRLLPLSALRPAPYNPRQRLRPGEPAYKKLARSLREFGLVEPLVWNETTGHVVGGHARLEILRSLGAGDVPVSVVRLSPEREKALNVVLNNREAQGRFDTDRLAVLLTEMQELPELELTGFELDDLAALHLEPLGEVEEK